MAGSGRPAMAELGWIEEGGSGLHTQRFDSLRSRSLLRLGRLWECPSRKGSTRRFAPPRQARGELAHHVIRESISGLTSPATQRSSPTRAGTRNREANLSAEVLI